MKKLIAVFAATLMALAIAAPAMAQSEARIHLIHGIPDTPVDVIVDGEAVISDFNFGDTQDLSAFAGATLTGLTVVLAGTDTAVIGPVDFDVPASGNYSVIAYLDAAEHHELHELRHPRRMSALIWLWRDLGLSDTRVGGHQPREALIQALEHARHVPPSQQRHPVQRRRIARG
jgi:hypothetical protein